MKIHKTLLKFVAGVVVLSMVGVLASVIAPQPKAFADVTAADCTSVQYFLPAAPGAGVPARCVNKLDYPRNADDCKAGTGYTYIPATATAGASCKLTTTTPAGTCSDGSSQDSDGNCTTDDDDITCGSGKFDWILCPFVTMGVKASQTMDNFIMNTLDIDVGPIFDQTTQKGTASNGYYVAWNSFRVIASVILLVAGLVMVTSQALGFELLDAYTVRKVLPRLLVAIIGISLSWPLMRFTVSLFDTVGFDLRELMYAPFKNFGGTLSVAGGILSTIGIGVGIMALGFASLSFLVTIGAAVFVGFATLVMRQVAIVMLIIVAPVAIACSVLPNTQKLWNLWRENFLGLMLMFPIISGLIAAGHIFSAVALANGGNNVTGSLTTQTTGLVAHLTGHNFLLNFAANTANNIGSVTAQAIALAAYFLPYFLIPMAAKLATGIVGNLAGMVNDRGRGVFDRMKKARGAAMGDRFQKAKNEQLWDSSHKLGKFGNKMASWATDPVNNAAYYGRNSVPGLKKRGRNVETHIEHARLTQSKKLLDEMSSVFNDKAYRAINGDLHRGLSAETQKRLNEAGMLGKTPRSLSDFNNLARILGESSVQDERLAGNAIHGMSGRLATLYQDPEMGKVSVASAGVLGLATAGKLNRNDLAPALNGLRKEGGAAYAQTVGTQAQLLVSKARPDLKAGYSIDYNEKDGFKDGLEVNGGLRAFEMFATLGPGDIAGAKREFFDDKIKGGSANIMEDILSRGKDKAAVQASGGRLATYRKAGLTKEQIIARYPDGLSDLKNEQAGNQYDAVLKVLLRNSGSFATGSMEIQSGSDAILRKAFTPAEYESLKSAEMTPEAIAAQGGVPPEGGGAPPSPGGSPFSPGPFG